MLFNRQLRFWMPKVLKKRQDWGTFGGCIGCRAKPPVGSCFEDLLTVNRDAYAPLSAEFSVSLHDGMARIGAGVATPARLNSATVAANIDALEGYIALHDAG